MVAATTAHRPFRFSFQAVQAGSRAEWIDLVKRVDEASFDLLVTADHLQDCLSPLLPLATAAEVSDRLRLGVMVLNNDFHHPSLLARDLATLDLLSDGRVEVGIGAGHAQPEYDRAGLRFDRASVRIDRLQEAAVVLRRSLGAYRIGMLRRCRPNRSRCASRRNNSPCSMDSWPAASTRVEPPRCGPGSK